MTKPNDGGPASEKSLRDEFALEAMKLAYSEDMTFEQMAKWSCDYADALIAELEKKVEEPKEAGEKPEPKFMEGDQVRVKVGKGGCSMERPGIVEAVFPDTFGDGFKYRVHVTDAMRETYYECQLEAAGGEGK